MQTSETTSEIFAALVQANINISNPKKTSKVNAGAKRYAFAPLPELLDDLRPILQANGLAFVQEVVDDGNGRVGSASMLVHRSGEWLRFDPLMLPAGNDAQGAGSAATYSRRYTLCAALGIAGEDDDDGAAASAPLRSQQGHGREGQGAGEKVKEPQGAVVGEGLSSAAPFTKGTEKAALWDQLVAAHEGSAKRALARLNSVPGVKPPFDLRNVGFAAEEQLSKALAKVGAA